MRRIVLLTAVAIALGACADWNSGRASSVIDAHVVRVVEQTSRSPGPGVPAQPLQTLEIELDGGLYRGEHVTLPWGGRGALNANGLLAPADRVLVSQTRGPGDQRQYQIEEIVRLPSLAPFAIALAAALLLVARWKGLASLAGLAGSIAVFLLAIVPAVQRGDDPLVATLAGAVAVLAVAVFVVHGFNRKSVAALLGAALCLAAVVALAAAALALAHVTGLGSEEAVFLAIGTGGRIDMHRLVLAGVVVGSLGALVDMAVGQASATFELAAAHDEMRGGRLYGSALNVGRDHIGSLVNTLALAYFGGSLPLIVLLSLGNAPVSLAVNSETVVGSIVSILVASIGLVLCVPLTTAIAVWLAGRSERQLG